VPRHEGSRQQARRVGIVQGSRAVLASVAEPGRPVFEPAPHMAAPSTPAEQRLRERTPAGRRCEEHTAARTAWAGRRPHLRTAFDRARWDVRARSSSSPGRFRAPAGIAQTSGVEACKQADRPPVCNPVGSAAERSRPRRVRASARRPATPATERRTQARGRADWAWKRARRMHCKIGRPA
jgi:hypothetical protein